MQPGDQAVNFHLVSGIIQRLCWSWADSPARSNFQNGVDGARIVAEFHAKLKGTAARIIIYVWDYYGTWNKERFTIWRCVFMRYIYHYGARKVWILASANSLQILFTTVLNMSTCQTVDWPLTSSLQPVVLLTWQIGWKVLGMIRLKGGNVKSWCFLNELKCSHFLISSRDLCSDICRQGYR